MGSILIVGGSGTLGRRIARSLTSLPDDIFIASRDLSKAKAACESLGERFSAIQLDPAGGGLPSHLGRSTKVVIAAPSSEGIQRACFDRAIPSVNVTLSTVGLNAMNAQQTSAGATHVLLAGLLPGLSGLLAVDAARRVGRLERLDLVLTQSANADVGVSGMRDMLRSLTRSDTTPPDQRPLMKMAHPEMAHLAARALATSGPGSAVHYWAAWDSPAQMRRIRSLQRARLLGLLAFLPGRLLERMTSHDPRQREAVTLEAIATGTLNDTRVERRRTLFAASDYGATAAAAAFLVRALAECQNGVWLPCELFDLEQFSVAGVPWRLSP